MPSTPFLILALLLPALIEGLETKGLPNFVLYHNMAAGQNWYHTKKKVY